MWGVAVSVGRGRGCLGELGLGTRDLEVVPSWTRGRVHGRRAVVDSWWSWWRRELGWERELGWPVGLGTRDESY